MVKKTKRDAVLKARTKVKSTPPPVATKPTSPPSLPEPVPSPPVQSKIVVPQRAVSDHLVDFGERIRIERRFRQEPNGTYIWHLYRLEDVKNGIHPVHKGKTSETQVWVKLDQGDEAAMRAEAVKLAGA